jgi:hypothetical protein
VGGLAGDATVIVPCGACNTDRQWQYVGAELVAGGAAGRIAVEAAGHMDLGEEEAPGSTRLAQGDGIAAAGTGDVDGQPCRDEVLGEVEEEERRASGGRRICQRASPAS